VAPTASAWGTADIIAQVDKLAAKVSSGELKVPDDIDKVEPWLKSLGK